MMIENDVYLQEGLLRNQLIALMDQTNLKMQERAENYNHTLSDLTKRENELKATINGFLLKLQGQESNLLDELTHEHTDVKNKLLAYLEMDTTSLMTKDELLELIEVAQMHYKACQEVTEYNLKQCEEIKIKIEELKKEYKRLAYMQLDPNPYGLWDMCQNTFKKEFPKFIHPFLDGVVKNKFNDVVAGRIALQEGE